MLNLHFNQLSPAQAERQAFLSEELGETVQAVGKIQRHGLESRHPDGGPTNRQALERELGDVLAAIEMMIQRGDVSAQAIDERRLHKLKTVERYMHHQPPAISSAGILLGFSYTPVHGNSSVSGT